jgi:alpha-glucosidase
MFPFTFPAWLSSVHHDGSEKYVSEPYPALGQVVRISIRIADDAPVRRVLLRTFPDGEQAFTVMAPGPLEPPCRWFSADLPVSEPSAPYRFLIEAADGAWWYSAAGPAFYEPLDVTDFQLLAGYHSPSWLREAVFYQIFPDRFDNANPATDPRPEEFEFRGQRPCTFPWGTPPSPGMHPSLAFYGGDLPGITRRLDYIRNLGATALYLNPIFTANTNHKYDVTDYDHVDPHFGGDEALVQLRQALDRRGMRYILDIVPNHCGFLHPWFQRAQHDPTSPEADFFTFTRRPDRYASWLGVWALPKLNYRSPELRRRIYAGPDAVFRRWLRPPFRADGWRVDVANMLARQGATQLNVEIARGIRQAVKETQPEAYLVGENFFDASPQLQGDMWDGVMNYMGFSLPLFHWLAGYSASSHGLKEPVSSPVSWPTAALAATWRLRQAAIPWAVARQQLNLLGSHDTSRARSILKGRDALHRLAVTLLLTFPGVPSLYYGDEIGLLDHPQLGSRGCMEWDEARWDCSLLAFHQDLVALRRRSPALQSGGFQILAVEPDTLAYQRESRAGRVLVVAHRAAVPRPAGPLPVAAGGIPDGARFVEHFSGAQAVVSSGALPLPELPQGAQLWESA